MACVRTGQSCNQSSSNIHDLDVSLRTLIILAEILILHAWVGPGHASADWYITVLKIQMKVCMNGRQVTMEQVYSTISIWSLSHKSIIKATFKSICPVPFSRKFVRKISANYYQCTCERVYF